MTTFLTILIAGLLIVVIVFFLLWRRALTARKIAQQQIEAAIRERDSEIAQARSETESAKAAAVEAYDRKVAEVEARATDLQQYYQTEADKLVAEADARVAALEPLRKYAELDNAETEVKKKLAEALSAASALQNQAEALLTEAKDASLQERVAARKRAEEIQQQAEALLTQATRDAGLITAEAERRAKETAGEAFQALRDKQLLENAAQAMQNVIDGYGDRYVIPTHSLLDELAVEFGYDAAGQSLAAAREQSRRMVREGEAATCDYVEANRREIAIRFAIDAFNGRVDAILSRVKHDNYGTLAQEIKDAFSLVNLNGHAFRDARILPAYLDARLAELKWAVVVQELARKQREEQRELKDKLRDEEKARREYAEKMRQAAREEEIKRQAIEETQRKLATAAAEEKAAYEEHLVKLRQELAEATIRKLTIAQQTKEGHVYIISNIGSFGENIYKIGQTRRPDPHDRVDELSVASVPFEFDIHALIKSDNAPALEHKLHRQLVSRQLNKINNRKEFFRVNLAEIRAELDKLKPGVDFTVREWTDKAVATEYMESLAIENNPQRKELWMKRQQALSARQLELDELQLRHPEDLEIAGQANGPGSAD
jgi:hypothetical protein